jgi:hypothetical protein
MYWGVWYVGRILRAWWNLGGRKFRVKMRSTFQVALAKSLHSVLLYHTPSGHLNWRISTWVGAHCTVCTKHLSRNQPREHFRSTLLLFCLSLKTKAQCSMQVLSNGCRCVCLAPKSSAIFPERAFLHIFPRRPFLLRC